jgi:hypothetical protein
MSAPISTWGPWLAARVAVPAGAIGVRAAAFYVSDKYELPKAAFGYLPFNVSYSPSRRLLDVANFALGYADISPTNLALAVESLNPIDRSEAECLRTQ